MPTTRKKTPQKDLTRKDGLPLNIQRLLILACEDKELCEAEPAVVCDSNPLFGKVGTDTRTSCRAKVRYFRQIREEEPSLYW